ncbi:hypothetical protein [Methylobacterium oxalidis]|nr:hypothetical protein [Methylobacterium oxalidis]GJE32462.1 hypothetical protein LDDCCGHA_2648 [Methylobacterium oxalidis]
MTKPLIIRNEEARRLAGVLAERLATDLDDVVVRALRAYEIRLAQQAPETGAARAAGTPAVEFGAGAGLTPAQQAELEAIRALVREGRKYRRLPGTSDHSDMYDEYGLPK